MSQEAWDAMTPEMRAAVRKEFPAMVPASARKTGS